MREEDETDAPDELDDERDEVWCDMREQVGEVNYESNLTLSCLVSECVCQQSDYCEWIGISSIRMDERDR